MPMEMQDFATSFRQAAEALEKLPALQESHSQKEQELSRARETNETLAKMIHDLQSTINELNERVRSLEVERDDAAFRELQTKENLEDLVRTFQSVAGLVSAKVAEHTPKPEVVESNAEAGIEPTAAEQAELLDFEGLPDFEEKPIERAKVQVENPLIDEVIQPRHKPQIEELPQTEATRTTYPGIWAHVNPSDKPSNVSWKDFVAGGGRRPYYVTDEMMNAA